MDKKKRRREKRLKRYESRKNFYEKINREKNLEAFVNDENVSGDIYDWQDAEGFGVETNDINNGYIDSVTGVYISPNMTNEEIEVLKDMGLSYNTTSDEKRLNTFQKKYKDMTMADHDKITSILGNDLYFMLKETGYFDSDQLIDEILNFEFNVTEEEIERALLSMLADINNIETSNVNTILEAMDLGFTLEEAIELTDIDMQKNILPQEGIQELSDRLYYEVGQTKLQKQLEEELHQKGEQFRRRN